MTTSEEDHNRRRLQCGGYLGEISALCFLHISSHISSLPLLLVGTGSQILLYDVELGKLLNSFRVFEGIRVHGISSTSLDPSTLTSQLVLFGEKRVKLFTFHLQIQLSSRQNRPTISAELRLHRVLPRFSHWVMDVLLVKDCEGGKDYLAVGLGDNSVCLWDDSKSVIVTDVRYPERTLLYSMRLWGGNSGSIRVACGTIYNEVIVWKLDSQPNDQHYEATHLNRLVGHEGSIFRLAWSPDGSRLISVSDDRCARIWNVGATKEDVTDSNLAGNILFGHTARVWDCYIDGSLIVTAGEDCSCRVWGVDGKQLLLIKEHSGRGIWRCMYDPNSSLLITAGFDSSVKVHKLHVSRSMDTFDQNRVLVQGLKERMEVFELSLPNLSDKHGHLNSKSEYVRCLHFTQEDTLYVATNNGYLHHVKLSSATDSEWTELIKVSEGLPIVCMDVLSVGSSEAWVAVGDGKGSVSIIGVVTDVVSTPRVRSMSTWSAGMERKILGIYWCRSLGPRYIFTADPRGTLKLWSIRGSSQSGPEQTEAGFEALLITEFTSCFGTRITCLDAFVVEQVLVCGDVRGNLITFSLPRGLSSTPCVSEAKEPPINSFKGAHGISSVTSISVSSASFKQIDIRSSGGDGCICYFTYNGDWKVLEFKGMKQVKELSLIQSVSSDVRSDEDLARVAYAVGFSSADFKIWNLENEMEVLQIPCGGWRRPHSYYLGGVPEYQNCFAFVKDHAIHIHRLWVPDSKHKLIPHILHLQYHGREIHSVCFISDVLQSMSNENTQLNRLCCVVSGCEDGTVRLTRYDPDSQNWIASKLLGEHVGGSAVRSICFVSKIYKISAEETLGCNGALNEPHNVSLLISVGAKRVLTSWLLQNRRVSYTKGANVGGDFIESTNGSPNSQELSTSMSFQWLSTDMPSKHSSSQRTMENSETKIAGNNNLDPNSVHADKNENDWRYLAVTSFLVRGADCRSTVCFILVSCSDATLTLRALVLPHRLWFDVAVLVPQTAPVLCLQNVILPLGAPSRDSLQVGGVYILISGSTDGSITFWDLTESVEGFMQRLSEIQPENIIDCQTRPRTGRGSQGGRWWKTLHNRLPKTGPKANGENTINCHEANPSVCEAPSDVRSPQTTDPTCITSLEVHTDDSSAQNCEIRPFHILNNVHQSGVNCLHVSSLKDRQNPESESAHCVLSGGDDQAIHSLTFELSLKKSDDDGSRHENYSDGTTNLRNVVDLSLTSESQHCRVSFVSHNRVASAHSSAVKGIWTDGTWAFSAGLDQRVRCWHLEEQESKLSEHGHLVVSVTEPETLNAVACGRSRYQIAVAGRGLQMVEFSTSLGENGC